MAISIGLDQRAAVSTSSVQDITVSGVGTPKLAVHLSTRATANNSATDHAIYGLGATDGTRERFCTARSENGVTDTATDRRAYSDQVTGLLWDTHPGVNGTANHDSWITDGEKIGWNNEPNNPFLIGTLFMGGAELEVYVGSFVPNASSSAGRKSSGVNLEKLFMDHKITSGGP